MRRCPTQRLDGRGGKMQAKAAEVAKALFSPKDHSSTQARYAPDAVDYAGGKQKCVPKRKNVHVRLRDPHTRSVDGSCVGVQGTRDKDEMRRQV